LNGSYRINVSLAKGIGVYVSSPKELMSHCKGFSAGVYVDGPKELLFYSPCKGFAVGVYVDGPKELMYWFIILSDNSLEYYFQRTI
jgi:uncharacterized protein YneR